MLVNLQRHLSKNVIGCMVFAFQVICRYIRDKCRVMSSVAVDFEKERESVIEWLGIKKSFPKRSSNALSYIKIIKEGLKSASVNTFAERSGLSKKQVSRMIHVSERTLQRNRPDKRMDVSTSERLVELARLFYKGIEVFGEREIFTEWLNRPNRSLENRLPIELIETGLGIDMVMEELTRIEHGVFS
jgi:putative toxin-antitoxin system antitoxin component (TIGR02293 family)